MISSMIYVSAPPPPSSLPPDPRQVSLWLPRLAMSVSVELKRAAFPFSSWLLCRCERRNREGRKSPGRPGLCSDFCHFLFLREEGRGAVLFCSFSFCSKNFMRGGTDSTCITTFLIFFFIYIFLHDYVHYSCMYKNAQFENGTISPS